MFTLRSTSSTCCTTVRLGMSWWILMASPTWFPMENTGFREVMGSWMISAIWLPRISLISLSVNVHQVLPFQEDLAVHDAARGFRG